MAPFGVRVALARGCFHESLRAVSAGRADIPLLLDHDEAQVLGSVRGGGMSVTADPVAVWLSVTGPWLAAAVDRHRGERPEMSAGFTALATRDGRDADGPYKVVMRGELTELSMVARGAFDGTYSDPARDAVLRLRAAFGRITTG